MEKIPGIKEGLSMGVFLSIFFSFSFALLGATINSSILLGIMGGVAGGFIVFFYSDDREVPPSEIREEEKSKLMDSPSIYQDKEPSKNTFGQTKKKPVPTLSLLQWLFKSNRRE
jgi:hypothetical protein